MINAFRRLLRYIEVLNNKRKLKFEIVVKNKIPRIQVKEKHEKKVKNITRLITAFGILVSVVSFSEWYYSLGVAILIFHHRSNIRKDYIYLYDYDDSTDARKMGWLKIGH